MKKVREDSELVVWNEKISLIEKKHIHTYVRLCVVWGGGGNVYDLDSSARLM